MTNRDKKDAIELAKRVKLALHLAVDRCDCWEGCNDRQGKLPCEHTIMWEGVKLWAERYPNVIMARYT